MLFSGGDGRDRGGFDALVMRVPRSACIRRKDIVNEPV